MFVTIFSPVFSSISFMVLPAIVPHYFAIILFSFSVSGRGGGPRHELETDKSVRKFDDQFEGRPIRDFHFCRLWDNQTNIKIEVIFYNKEQQYWYTGDSITIDY